MSYILDALRKSDQQRRRGFPLLLAAQGATRVPRRAPRILYGLIALVLLGAGVAIGWLRPWQQGPALTAAPVVVKPPAAAANAAAPEVSRPAQEVQPKEVPPPMALAAPKQDAGIKATSPPARLQAATRSPKKVVKQTSMPRAGEVAAIESQTASRTPEAQAPVQNAASLSSHDDEARAQSGVPINELPVSIQKDLPAMSIMVHAYSEDPEKRLVGINNRLLHEGDEVAPGLKLESITLDGMILSYKGYSFHRGVR